MDVCEFFDLMRNTSGKSCPPSSSRPLLDMSLSASQTALQVCQHVARSSTSIRPRVSSRCVPLFSSTQANRQRRIVRRWQSTEAATPTDSTNPKIVSLVDEISKLTLLETADLVTSLKVYFSIPIHWNVFAPSHTSITSTRRLL